MHFFDIEYIILLIQFPCIVNDNVLGMECVLCFSSILRMVSLSVF